MSPGQAEHALQDPRAFDAAGVQHRFGPLVRVRTDAADLAKQIADAAFHAVDLLGGQVLGVGAEAALLVPHVHGDLLETLIEDPHQRASQRAQTACPRYSGGTE